MKDERRCFGGGSFDRGVICEKQKVTNWQYRVKSYTHQGVTSRWMEAASAYCNEYTSGGGSAGKYEYQVNDEVYYCLFPDGRGLILGKMMRE